MQHSFMFAFNIVSIFYVFLTVPYITDQAICLFEGGMDHAIGEKKLNSSYNFIWVIWKYFLDYIC